MRDSNPPRGAEGGRAEDLAWSPPAENPYTFQGEVAGLAAFASGVSRSQDWKRWVGSALALMVVGGFLVALILGILTAGAH